MEIRNVLVPVSFAPSCKKAFRMAAMLASAFGAKLYVMNVYRTLPRLFYSVGGALFTKDMEQQRVEIVTELDRFVRLELKKLKISLEFEEIEVAGDDTVDAILNVAKEKEIDLMVLGHHEEMKLEHFLFGRNIEKIVEGAPCDVMITRTELYKKGLGVNKAA